MVNPASPNPDSFAPSPLPEGPEWKISDMPVPYEEAVRFMEARAAAIAEGKAEELVWLLEHPPLYTAGTSADPADLLTPERYLPMMPPYIPFHGEVIFFTGLCEIAGAIGLLTPRLKELAAMMLALYAVAVFPANVHNAMNGLSVAGLPEANLYYWARLFFQPLIIWWALYAGGLIGKRAPQAA